MKLDAFKEAVSILFKIVTTVFVFILIPSVYLLGLLHGQKIGQFQIQRAYEDYLNNLESSYSVVVEPSSETGQNNSKAENSQNQSLVKSVDWGGPDLWEAVNNRRKEFGVNPLSNADELCTIASLRLNELLELGGLDGHEGFGNLKERRPDLAWIIDKYSTVAEFLLAGADSASEAVSLWENTLGHKKLLTGGEYVWGCIYAQNSFAVAITAF